MQLTVWTYEGPPHVGAMRIATAMEGLHYVLHAPQGDTYADLLFTMIERRGDAPAGHLHHLPGARPRRRHRRAVQDRRRARPTSASSREAMIVGASCTAELIQDDPGRPRQGARPADPGDRRWSCPPTRRRRTGARPRPSTSSSARSPARTRRRPARRAAPAPRCNILGPTALGFRHRDDVARDHRPARPHRHRRSTSSRPLGATPGRSRPARRGRLQRRALSRDRRRRRPPGWSATFGQPYDADRARSASAPPATSSPRSPRSPGIDAAPVLAAETSRAALVLALGRLRPTSPASASSSSATPPMPSPPPASPRDGARLQGRRPRHLQPRVRPRRPRARPSATASRR